MKTQENNKAQTGQAEQQQQPQQQQQQQQTTSPEALISPISSADIAPGQPKPSAIADDAFIVQGLNELQIAFPNTSREFFRLLGRTIRDKHFTRAMWVRTVRKTIETYPYKQLTIAAVLQARFKQDNDK
mgnify:CR=1 FL=1